MFPPEVQVTHSLLFSLMHSEERTLSVVARALIQWKQASRRDSVHGRRASSNEHHWGGESNVMFPAC